MTPDEYFQCHTRYTWKCLKLFGKDDFGMFEQLLAEYADRFNDNFPTFQTRNLPEDEIIKLIKTALETNKPYEFKGQENVDY